MSQSGVRGPKMQSGAQHADFGTEKACTASNASFSHLATHQQS